MENGGKIKPDVVYIFCDELRCDALSCYDGAPEGIRTPNLDRLAQEGALFENCFCNSPVCVPSRYSLLTGLYPETTGIYHNEAAGWDFPGKDRFTTIPEVFASCGYRTANFGKQHLPLGVNPFQKHDPEGSKIKLDKDREKEADIIATRGIGSPVGGRFPEDLDYPPNQVTTHALAWMEEQTEPYFVRISYLQPHTPVVVPEPYYSLYDGLKFPDRDRADADLSLFDRCFAANVDDGNLTAEERYRAKVCYYGLVRWIDDQVGKVLEFLEQRGRLDNTILLFGADHGAMLGENHRYAKQNFSRSAHRVPLLIRFGGRIEPGARGCLCENLDVGRTLFALAGLEAPEQFRGRNLFGEGGADCVYGSIGYGEKGSFTFPNKKLGRYKDGMGWPRRACIRSLRYRLDMNVRIDGRAAQKEEEDVFLADLEADPLEQYNMAEKQEYREIVRELKELLIRHMKAEEEAGGQ